MERRYSNQRKVQISRRADGPSRLEGYAAVFYRESDKATEYELWPGLIERVMPGAFDRALRERQDVRALFNHDASAVLGRTGPGTLRLNVDDVGLRYEIDLPDTQAGRDVATSVERGDVTGSSFSFAPHAVTWKDMPDMTIRELTDVDLYDVSPVTFPAYEGTSVAARSESGVDELRAEYEKRKTKLIHEHLRMRQRQIEIAESM